MSIEKYLINNIDVLLINIKLGQEYIDPIMASNKNKKWHKALHVSLLPLSTTMLINPNAISLQWNLTHKKNKILNKKHSQTDCGMIKTRYPGSQKDEGFEAA